MTVQVRTFDETITTFSAAEKWVIDDHEMLHVVGSDGNLASYGRGGWQSIVKVAEEE